MTYFIILFASPLYFLTRKQWGGFIFNAILYFMAWGFVITIFLAPVGVFFWALSAGHAGWSYRTELMHESAQILAVKVAQEMKK